VLLPRQPELKPFFAVWDRLAAVVTARLPAEVR
jgi:hypothetical protein